MTVTILDAEIDVFEADSTNSADLANQWPMNETRGTTGNDVAGSANLTLKSGITVNSDTFDNLPTYGFDGGSKSYAAINAKNFASSGAISEITVGAWIKTSETGTNKGIIGFDRDEYFGLVITSGDVVEWSTTDSSGSSSQDDLTGSTNIVDGNWHLVAGVFDADGTNEKRIHIDGSEETTNSPHSGNNLGTGTTRYGFIGDDSEASSEDGSTDGLFYQGDMAGVFIYDRALSNQELTDIYNAGAVSIPPDFTIPASNITSIDASQRIDKRRDTGRIVIENNDGTYDVSGNEINSGDLLRLRTKLQGESSLSHQWSAMADTILYEQVDYNKANIRIEATDFVFGVISNRIVENSFEGVDIFSIVDSVMSGEAPEIHRDRVQNITKTIDSHPRGTNLLDLLNELAQKGNAVLSNNDRSLVFEKAEEAPFAFAIDASDKDTHLIRKEGSSIINEARVDGGLSSAVDDEQTTQTSTTTVTESSRITHQLSTRKATVSRIELYTSDSGSGEDFVIRLQKDSAGSPVSVGDSESDIVSKQLSVDDPEYVEDGLSLFIMPDHVLPAPNPWMIIESTGSSGQDIGVDGSNNPNYKAYFQFRLSTISGNSASQATYRQRSVRRFHGSLRTRNAAKEVANSIVSHNKEPDEFIEFRAQSSRAHNLKVGELIEVNETNSSGDFIVAEKTTDLNGLNLNTTISAQKVSTI